MRSIFKMDIKGLAEYETQLIDVFPSMDIPFKSLKKDLAQTYYDLRSIGDGKRGKFFDKVNARTNNFGDLMTEYSLSKLSHDNKKAIAEKLFYQSFWHSLFPLSTKLNPLSPGSVSFTIIFNDTNKSMPKKSFPYKLSQMIYKKSFY